MRSLIVSEFLSLDGVVDSPGGGTHPEAGWTFKQVPFLPEAYTLKGIEQDEAGALMMGRISYEEFSPIWPSMEEFAVYNAMPKYVVSTTLTETDPAWQPMTILRSADEVAALKDTAGGPILVAGSPTLSKSLLKAGLVDRFNLLVFPVLLGTGKRLFDDAASLTKLDLVDSETYGNGIVKLIYDVAH